MGSLTISIAGSSSVTKTIQLYSNTDEDYVFQATWSINDNLFTDTPTSDIDWTYFKATYVTAGTGDNNINVDLAQYAADNGSVAGGALHSYTITSFCNSSECQSNLNSNTIEVEAAGTALGIPVNFTVTGKLFGADASWDSVVDATEYVLNYKLTTEPTTWTEVVTSSLSEDLDGLLVNDLEYNFRVKARNLSGDSSFSSVIDVTPFDFRETGVERHYVFGDDNLSYLDIDGANGATKLGTGHTQLSGYVSTLKVGSFPYLNGIQSNVTDKATEQTLIIVGQMYSDVNGAIVMGNMTPSSSEGGIATLQQHAGGRIGDFFIENRGTVPFHYIEDTSNPSAQIPIHNGWFFFAHSLNSTGRKTFYQDSTMSSPVIQTATGTVNLSTPVRALGWGNIAYDSSSRKHGMKIAEGMIFQTGKTDAELTAIYARSVARLGLRGITV